MTKDTLLSLRGITKAFGGLKAVDGVTFDVSQDEIVSLVGPNGSGKTTLFNCISGIYRPNEGSTLFFGKDVTPLSPPQRCKLGIGRTFQVVRPFLRLSCIENVLVGLHFGQEDHEKKNREEALKILHFVGLGERADQQAQGLRLAERKRLEIARALATRPQLILLDEVAAGLNEVETQQMTHLLRQIHAKGTSLLVVEHVMSLVMDISHRIVVLNEGRKIADGPPEVVANDPRVIEVYLGESHLGLPA